MNLELIKTSLETKLNEYGYSLSSFSYGKKQGDNVLSLVVDRVEPIDMETIIEISDIISAYLDDTNMIEEAYLLDVSSLGAEKPLKVEELSYYVGKYVHVHLINPIEGENIYEGDIKEVNEDNFILQIRIKTRVKLLTILLSNIYNIRLAIKF